MSGGPDRELGDVLVDTTVGRLRVSQLGRTMVHEHLHVGAEGLRQQWPHLYDDAEDLSQSIEQIRDLHEAHGVRTICDPACMDLDRNVRLNIAVSEATGVAFVIATGVYCCNYTSVPVFVSGRPEVFADCFVHDIEVGVQGTDVRAGFLKCAADRPGMTPDVEMVHRAVARAALATGAPIMAHSSPAAGTGLEQMRLFAEEGVPSEAIQIAHTGDTDDLDYIERLLDTGCYIGMDRYGLHLATERRNATVATLVERGYGPRMMLGHDSVVRLDGRTEERRLSYSPDNRLGFLFEIVIPGLRDLGVDDAQLEAMVGLNVHNWLASRSPAAPAKDEYGMREGSGATT